MPYLGVSDGDWTRVEGIVPSNGEDEVATHPMGDDEGESDCEDDHMGTEESTPAPRKDYWEQEDNVPLRSVLIPGSFAS